MSCHFHSVVSVRCPNEVTQLKYVTTVMFTLKEWYSKLTPQTRGTSIIGNVSAKQIIKPHLRFDSIRISGEGPRKRFQVIRAKFENCCSKMPPSQEHFMFINKNTTLISHVDWTLTLFSKWKFVKNQHPNFSYFFQLWNCMHLDQNFIIYFSKYFAFLNLNFKILKIKGNKDIPNVRNRKLVYTQIFSHSFIHSANISVLKWALALSKNYMLMS